MLLGSSWGSCDLGGLLGVLGASWRRLDGVLGRLGVLGNAKKYPSLLAVSEGRTRISEDMVK